ncbi:hypothetical protein AA18890_2663 [Komagataeibacter europaeus LMG 18890]|nr:hypothetical protein AA18890_2663 [Komagataeibacter europaeus LMG 18890]
MPPVHFTPTGWVTVSAKEMGRQNRQAMIRKPGDLPSSYIKPSDGMCRRREKLNAGMAESRVP